ncbi:hypothetical protein PENSPDRAFT_284211 [Peniophora sp. CONT]|nr:hypothetical protein PENSPDRAFT_284211 [Peniophora sp. CONT]
MEGEAQSQTLGAIHRLDKDSLTEIFFWFVRDERFKLVVKFKDLIRITHICRGWRELGLDLAELWGDVVFASGKPDVFSILLQRARNAPLDLPFSIPAIAEQLQYIGEHPERFRVMNIARSVQWDPASLAGKHLPHLEIARLYARPQNEHFYFDLAPVVMPYARDLYFSLFCIPFNAPNLCNLRITATRPFEPRALVSMLNALPQLCHLKLRYCLPISYIQDGDGVERIELPKISYIDLKDFCISATVFLEQLQTINPESTVHLSLNPDVRGSRCEPGRLAQAVRPYLRVSSRNALVMALRQQFVIAAYPSNNEDSDEYNILQHAVTIRTEARESSLTFYTAFFEQLCVSHIRHLSIHQGEVPEGSPSAHDMTLLLRDHIRDAPVQTVKHHMSFIDNESRFDRSRTSPLLLDEPTLWPQLRELTLSEDACVYVSTIAEGASSLLNWLEKRVATGSPLERLRLLGERYDSERYDSESPSFESLDVQGEWDLIEDIVNVVDA